MIGSAYENIIEELGKALKTTLKPDAHGACLLKFKNGIQVQLEADGETILMVSEIAPLSEGRFRENVFKEALKANGLPPPRHGIFAHSKKAESLVLYDSISMIELSGIRLAEQLRPFVTKAHHWKEALNRGEIPSFTENEQTFGLQGAPKQGIFGLIQ